MKRLFISCPMRGRTEKAIKATMEKMHRIAEAVFNEELEVLPTYIEDEPPTDTNQRLWYLGESIQMMANADYFIGIYDSEKEFNGCIIENHVAKLYDVPQYLVNLNFVAPDVIEGRKAAKDMYHGGVLLL